MTLIFIEAIFIYVVPDRKFQQAMSSHGLRYQTTTKTEHFIMSVITHSSDLERISKPITVAFTTKLYYMTVANLPHSKHTQEQRSLSCVAP